MNEPNTTNPSVTPPSKTALKLARQEAIKAQYELGRSLRSIAAEEGVTYQAIHQILKRQGVPMRPRGGNQGSHSRHRK